MAIKTLRVFAEYTSTGFVPMPTAGGIDYGYTLANTFPSATPSSFQTDDPDIDVTVTAMTDFYVWIRINGTAWNPSYTRNVRVYPDSPDINSVVMNMIIATGPAGTSAYSQIVQTSNRLYFNGATADSTYNSKFAGKTYINELNFGTAPGLATVATTGAYADLTGKPALSTVATSGSYGDLSNKPSGTAPISYNSGTNSFQISVASASTNGYLTSTDWSTFNAKYLLPSGGTTAQYLRGDGTLATFPTTLDSTRLIFTGKNATGSTLTKGTVVYINGVSGNTALLAKAIASGDSTSAQTLGVVEFDIANNQSGVVVLVGSVANLDTSSFTEGVQLYLSGTTAGAFTSSKVLAPTHLVYVGIVTRAHPTQGTIEVKIQNGYELDEIHDVQISSPADKDILYRDSASSLWKHASIASVLGYTPYNASNPNNYIALTALSASAPLSYNNTTGAFTISQANTTTNGFLSSTDWNTFNSKQSALTLGNVSEVSSNVLMFPDGGTGKTIGNLTIQVVQASASTNGYLSSTDWTTFNNKQATITGGASTITTSNLTASRALISNASGKVDVSTVTSTELGYLSGVTSAIQTQLNAKQNTITNPVTGTGTTNYVTKWTSSSAIGNSLIFDNGTSIGIGTATPSTFLHIVGANTANRGQLSIQSNNTSNAAKMSFYYDTTLQGNIGTVSSDFYLESINNLSIYAGGAERLKVTTGGNLQIKHSTSDTGIEMFYNGTTSTGAMLADANNFVIGGQTGKGLVFCTNNLGQEKMRIDVNGNIGIGTTNPSTRLTISKPIDSSAYGSGTRAIDFKIYFPGFDVDTIKASIYSGVSSIGSLNTQGGYLGFMTSLDGTLAERVRIEKNGNVGIGTTTPSHKLDISAPESVSLRLNNTGNSTDSFIQYNNTATAFSVGVGANGWFFYTGQTKRYDFWIANVIQLQLASSGNLLLGTTSDPGYKLYVNGQIYATSNITANSDLTLKKNLKLVENPIDKLNQLNGYLYQWKKNDEYQYGVIAQEVEKILPYAVTTGKDGIKGVSYNQIIPVLIEAVKELNAEVKLLKAK